MLFYSLKDRPVNIASIAPMASIMALARTIKFKVRPLLLPKAWIPAAATLCCPPRMKIPVVHLASCFCGELQGVGLRGWDSLRQI